MRLRRYLSLVNILALGLIVAGTLALVTELSWRQVEYRFLVRLVREAVSVSEQATEMLGNPLLTILASGNILILAEPESHVRILVPDDKGNLQTSSTSVRATAMVPCDLHNEEYHASLRERARLVANASLHTADTTPQDFTFAGEFCYSQPADDPDTGTRTTWTCQDCRRQSVWVAMVPVFAPAPAQRSQDFQVMDQRTIGYVEVIQSREFLQEVHRQLWITFFVAILASLCLLGAATYAIARFFTAPLMHITESIRGIQSDTEIIRPVQVRHTRGITEISALRDAFRGLQRRLGHSWEVRQQLASNLSHELRNALGALELDIATLSRHVHKDKFAAEVAADMKQNVSELLEMSDRSLNALFTETGHVALNLETVELAPLVQQVLASVEEVAADRNVRVTLDSLDGVESVEVDRVYFKNDVLLELVLNAINYTGDGGAVTIGAGGSEAWCAIRIRDTGPGVAPQHQEAIFEPYFRVDPTNNPGLNNRGLGLSLARNIVRRHRGDIRYHSLPNGGSEFSILLPISNLAGANNARVPDAA